jgi:hypothetical protein
MKNAVFWNVAGSSLADFSTMKMEAIRSSETLIHFTGSTRHRIPADGILHMTRSFPRLGMFPIVKSLHDIVQ